MSFIRKRPWVLIAVVIIVGLALDIITKRWAVAVLTPREQLKAIGSLLSFTLVYNTGAVFGLDPHRIAPWLPVNPFFEVFSVIAMVVVLYYYRMVSDRDRLAQWGLALVMPGALGNLIDRFVHGRLGVVDFVMLNIGVWPANPWPIFNVADVCVTFGVLLILGSILRDEFRRRDDRAPIQATVTAGSPAGPDDSHAGD